MTWTFYNAQGQEKQGTTPPPSSEYIYRSGGWSTAVSTAATTWKSIPIASGVPTLTPAGAFVENADGSITVRDAGYYKIDAVAICVSTTTFSVTLGPNNNAQNYFAAEDDTGTGASKQISLGSIWYFNAGDKVYLTVYTGAIVTNNVQCRAFAIARLGAGPAGAAGTPGAKGDPGYYEYAWRSAGSANFTSLSSGAAESTMVVQAGPHVVTGDAAAFSLAANKITVRDAGLYSISTVVSFNSVATVPGTGPFRIVRLYVNGSQVAQELIPAVANEQVQINLSTTIYLAANSQVWWTGASTEALAQTYMTGAVIARVGAGPIGPAGPQGPTSFPAASNLNFNNFKAISLGYPTNAQDAASKQYVDDVTVGQVVNTGFSTKIAWGSITLSVVGQTVGTLTINHGLGAVPVFVTCTPFDLSDPTKMLVTNMRSLTSTQAVFSVKRIGAATTTDTHTFYWFAIAQL